MFLVILLLSVGFGSVGICTYINEEIKKNPNSKKNGYLKLYAKVSVQDYLFLHPSQSIL